MTHDDPGDALAVRRKRLLFRSWHRGTREADLLLGSFAERHIQDFTPEQLDRFERLLEVADPDLYNWMTGKEPVPAEYDHDVMHRLKSFRFVAPSH